MAARKKTAAKKDLKSIEQSLWDTANKLRGSVESSEYKHVVLGLIFLKFASDKFERRRAELIAEGREKYVDMVEFCAMRNVFYLPEESRWSHVQRHAKQGDIALRVDTALAAIEKNNKPLAGALPDNYFSRLGLDTAKLSSLIDSIDDIDTVADRETDVVGRVYEYFLGKFAAAESSTASGEGEIRRKIVENDLVDCMMALPGQLFYTTQIPVCLWFLSRTKTALKIDNKGERVTRDRQGETLFIDARSLGSMTDRTHKELTDDDIGRITRTYHAWRGEKADGGYEDVAGFCRSATLDDIRANDFALTPGRYVGAAAIEGDGVPFEVKMAELTERLLAADAL